MDQAVATPTQAGHNRPRNPGVRLAPDWFESVGVNASAVERRAATLTTRRSVKKEYQAAWLLKAMTCIDLTTLSGDDTPGRVRRLCAKARHPLGEDRASNSDGLGREAADAVGVAVAGYEPAIEVQPDRAGRQAALAADLLHRQPL